MGKSIIKYQEGSKTKKSLAFPTPTIYTSFQEADADLNQKDYDPRTGDRHTYYQGTLSGPTISAKNTPIGYRSDKNSIREDILNTSPLLHSKIPNKYDKYKIADRISYGAAAVDPSTQGLIDITKTVATLPQYVAPLPFQKPLAKGLSFIGKKLQQSIESAPGGLEKLRVILNNQDDKLGSWIEQAPEINMQEIAYHANQNLTAGMKVKKLDVPISLNLESYGKYQKNNRDFTVMLDNKPSGYMRLEPINVNRSFTEILAGKSKYMPQFKNASGAGLQKRNIYPFDYLNLELQNKIKNQGIYGEINAALQKSLEDKGLKLYSGGSSLSEEAFARYQKELAQGRVKDISRRGASEEFRVFEHVNPNKQVSNSMGTPSSFDTQAQQQIDTWFKPIEQAINNYKSQLNSPKYQELVNHNIKLGQRVNKGTTIPMQQFTHINDLQEHRRFLMNNTKNEISYANLPGNVNGQNHSDGFLKSKLIFSNKLNLKDVPQIAKHEAIHDVFKMDSHFSNIESIKLNKALKSYPERYGVQKKYGIDPDYLRDDSEIYAHSVGNIAHNLGIKPYSQYPGYETFRTMLHMKADKPFIVESFKLNNKRDYKRVFDLISGSLITGQGVQPLIKNNNE